MLKLSSTMRFPGRGGPIAAEEAMRLLKSVYYDLTAMGQVMNLRLLAEFVPADRLLVGSDYPFRPEAVIPAHVSVFDAFDGFSEPEKAAIRTGTAIRLFPGLRDSV